MECRLRHERPLRHVRRRHRLRRRRRRGLHPAGHRQLLERHRLLERLRGLERRHDRRRQLVVHVPGRELPRRRLLHRARARDRRGRQHADPDEPHVHLRRDLPERRRRLPPGLRGLQRGRLGRGLRDERALRHLLRRHVGRRRGRGLHPARHGQLLERHRLLERLRGLERRHDRRRRLGVRPRRRRLPRRRQLHRAPARDRRRRQHGCTLEPHLHVRHDRSADDDRFRARQPHDVDRPELRVLLERGRLHVRVPARRRRLERLHEPEGLHQPGRRQPHLRCARHGHRRQHRRLRGEHDLGDRHGRSELDGRVPRRLRELHGRRVERRLHDERALRHLLRRLRLRRRGRRDLHPAGLRRLLGRHRLHERHRGLERRDPRGRRLGVRLRRGELPRRRLLHGARPRARRRREHRDRLVPHLRLRRDRAGDDHRLDAGGPDQLAERDLRLLLERARLDVRVQPRRRRLDGVLEPRELPRPLRRQPQLRCARHGHGRQHRRQPGDGLLEHRHDGPLQHRELPERRRQLHDRRVERRLRDERALRHLLRRLRLRRRGRRDLHPAGLWRLLGRHRLLERDRGLERRHDRRRRLGVRLRRRRLPRRRQLHRPRPRDRRRRQHAVALDADVRVRRDVAELDHELPRRRRPLQRGRLGRGLRRPRPLRDLRRRHGHRRRRGRGLRPPRHRQLLERHRLLERDRGLERRHDRRRRLGVRPGRRRPPRRR